MERRPLLSRAPTVEAKPYEGQTGRVFMDGMTNATQRALLLVVLMLAAPLSGCFGEEDVTTKVNVNQVLTVDGLAAGQAELRAGEWHELLLVGDGLRISAPAHDVLLFVDGALDIDSSVPVDGDRVALQLLTTPYTTEVELTIYTKDGSKTVFNPTVTNRSRRII